MKNLVAMDQLSLFFKQNKNERNAQSKHAFNGQSATNSE
jgi:hypothetical protein